MKPLNRTIHALKRWPDVKGWRFTALVFGAYCAFAAMVGLGSGFLEWKPSLSGFWQIALIAFFIPALGEEVVFRGLIAPKNTVPWALASLMLFILWHPLQALTWMPAAKATFLSPIFLSLAAALGLSCWIVRWRTGSLWPAVMLHWWAVLAWKAGFGGPAFVSL